MVGLRILWDMPSLGEARETSVALLRNLRENLGSLSGFGLRVRAQGFQVYKVSGAGSFLEPPGASLHNLNPKPLKLKAAHPTPPKPESHKHLNLNLKPNSV